MLALALALSLLRVYVPRVPYENSGAIETRWLNSHRTPRMTPARRIPHLANLSDASEFSFRRPFGLKLLARFVSRLCHGGRSTESPLLVQIGVGRAHRTRYFYASYTYTCMRALCRSTCGQAVCTRAVPPYRIFAFFRLLIVVPFVNYQGKHTSVTVHVGVPCCGDPASSRAVQALRCRYTCRWFEARERCKVVFGVRLIPRRPIPLDLLAV